MRLLITGGCGFIGSNFIRYMFSKYADIQITNLDKLTYCGNLKNLKDIENNKRYSFIKGDICDGDLVDSLVKRVDIVVNFAAESHVDRSIKYPDDFLMTNIYGVKTLLEKAKKATLRRFIQISSDEVYGSVPSGFSKEMDSLRPNSPYAASKASGDLLALAYYSTYKIPVTIVRSSNNFGPFQYPEKVIPLFVTNLLEGEKIPLYGDGLNTRDWLFVEDNCSGIDFILRNGKTGEIYNLGGGNHLTNFELTKRILKEMDKGKDFIEYVNDRPGHDRRYALDSSRMKELGWKPLSNFDEKLRETVNWYKENRFWWEPLCDKAEIIKW